MKQFSYSIARLLGRSIVCTAMVIGISASTAHADTTVIVGSQTDIWLAGQPAASSVSGFFGTDIAPANSPVGVSVSGGSAITFSILAFTPTSVDDSCFDASADAGVCYPDEFGFSPGPANSISLANLPAGALVGVFVAAGGPSGATPSTLNFTGTGGIGTAFSTLSPDLDQLFFIGDGLTGTGTGSTQRFLAPSGAATLYLAVSDSLGSSTGNLGSITADVSASAVSPIPEPGTLSLVALGLTGLIGAAKRKISR